mgnify:CR=1 FL=1
MKKQGIKKSYLEIILKNKTNRTYFYLILIFVGYMLFMFQMNLSIIKLETRMISGNFGEDSSNLVSLPPGTSESKIVAAMLPQDKDINRPFKWKGKTVTLSVQKQDNGYDMLVDMERSIPLSSLNAQQKSRYDSLIMKIYHPCCDAPVGACGCKHAVAIRGLIKNLLVEGWSDDQIYEEAFLWLRFWWPKHYAQMGVYLVSQGTDPSEISPQEWDGRDYSTIRSGRVVAAKLRRLNLK